MKNLFNNTNETNRLNGVTFFRHTERFNTGSANRRKNEDSETAPKTNRLLTPNAHFQMSVGQIPDLWDTCRQINKSANSADALYSVYKVMEATEFAEPQIKAFLRNRQTRHVLVDNNYLKIVLIHWKPGTISEIHGHANSRCIFKVIRGKLEEVRYTPEESPKFMTTSSYRAGNIAYIDDTMAYHQVGNPYGISAISLHVYLK